MAVAKGKLILTTREVLNYFYDIVVPQTFECDNLTKIIQDKYKTAETVLSQITPSLLFDQPEVSTLMKNISDGDPLRYNDENSDNYVLQYCMDENVGPTLKSEFAKTPYAEFISQSDNIDLINNDKELKKTALMCLIRINAIKNGTITDKRFIQFIKQLYSYKTGNHRGLNVLYKKVKDAVYALVGVGEDGKSCLIKQTPEYSLYEAMELEPDISKIPHATEQDKVFEQFVPEITIGFTVKNASKNSAVELNLDYALYDMLEKIIFRLRGLLSKLLAMLGIIFMGIIAKK